MKNVTEKETMQRQAFEIQQPGADFDPKVLPQNGEEYLMHMLYERKHCPPVVTKYPKAGQTLPKPSSSASVVIASKEIPTSMLPLSNIKPTKEWKTMQANEFLKCRSKIMLLRMHLANNNYDVNLEPPLISDESAWMKFCKENSPHLRIMLRLSQHKLEQLLRMLSEWLGQSLKQNQSPGKLTSDRVTSDGDNDNDGDCAMEIAPDEFKNIRLIGCWIYAVMACLETPLIPDLHNTLRYIARICMALRNALEGDSFEAAVPYNLLIYLIAHAFNQSDLLEFV